MSSWALVCDVWYLEPQTMRPGETPMDFANRVKVRSACLYVANFVRP